MTARSKRGAAVAVSIVVHLAILAVLALTTPLLRLPTARFAPDIAVELSPPLDRLAQSRRTMAAAAPHASAAQAAKPLPAQAALSRMATQKAETPNQPTPPAPEPAPAPKAASPAGTASGSTAAATGAGKDWRVRPEDGDFRGVVRAAIGCGHVEHLKLTADEQAACNRRLGDVRTANLPRYDPVPPEKRAYYDAVVAAYAKMHAGTPILYTAAGDNTGTTERWAGPKGAHMPGFGCKIPFGIPKGWKAPKGGPAHSVKLGALPCYITPPSGFLTEEADIPSAVDLPARK